MVVIPGTANPDHLRANLAAAKIAENLTDAEVARLTGLVDESKAVIDQPPVPARRAQARDEEPPLRNRSTVAAASPAGRLPSSFTEAPRV
jgi:hypothetical protein